MFDATRNFIPPVGETMRVTVEKTAATGRRAVIHALAARCKFELCSVRTSHYTLYVLLYFTDSQTHKQCTDYIQSVNKSNINYNSFSHLKHCDIADRFHCAINGMLMVVFMMVLMVLIVKFIFRPTSFVSTNDQFL